MKSLGKRIGLALILYSAILYPPGVSGRPTPQIVFKSNIWDFGRIKSYEIVTHEFVFENKGDQALHIKNVETSCGCAAAVVAESRILPGKSEKVKVTFNAWGYKGEVTKFIFIETDDPANLRAKLTIKALVETAQGPKIELDKAFVDSGLLMAGEDLSAEAVVRNVGGADLQFRGELPFAEFLVNGRPAAFPVKIKAGGEATLAVKLHLEGYKGYFQESVLLTANDPVQSTLSLQIIGYVLTKVELQKLFDRYKSILK